MSEVQCQAQVLLSLCLRVLMAHFVVILVLCLFWSPQPCDPGESGHAGVVLYKTADYPPLFSILTVGSGARWRQQYSNVTGCCRWWERSHRCMYARWKREGEAKLRRYWKLRRRCDASRVASDWLWPTSDYHVWKFLYRVYDSCFLLVAEFCLAMELVFAVSWCHLCL